MKISIVTPSFNQAQFIERTIESVVSQQGDFELEYKVVDGGSTDGTLAILDKYDVDYTSEPDRGQVDAINKGLHRVTGDVVGWLNSDDVLAPGALARVAAAFVAHRQAEWVHGYCEIIDANDQPIRRWISRYKDYRCRTHTLENFLTENYVSQMTVFWRRGVLDEIGYLNPGLKYAFDYDLWLRLAARGAPVYIHDPIACFRWYESSKSGEGFVVQMTETADLGARHPQATPWTRVRARAKNAAIIKIYRGLALARRVLPHAR